jgi:hypothetical protein
MINANPIIKLFKYSPLFIHKKEGRKNPYQYQYNQSAIEYTIIQSWLNRSLYPSTNYNEMSIHLRFIGMLVMLVMGV